MLGGLAFASWSQWLTITQVAIAVGFALLVALLLLFVPVVRDASLGLRLPAIVGAHLALLLGGLLSWSDEQLTVPAGVAIVGTLIAVARITPCTSASATHTRWSWWRAPSTSPMR
jgi:hypothetical protein